LSRTAKDIDPREWHFLVRFLTIFIMLRSIRDGMCFFYPEQLSNATSTILALLTATNLITIISLGMLTSWLKIGFWIFLGIQIANVPICLSAGLGIIQSLLGVFSAGLLWLFLQIPKDSYSGWDYLSGNYVSIRDTEKIENSKKCRMCNTKYTGAVIGCPKCGSFLYEEIATNKRCRMCNTVYAGSLNGCPRCGSSLYEETTEQITENSEQVTENREQGTVNR